MFGAVIVANAIVARFVKDPTEPRFIWRAVPIQLVGLSLLIDYRQSAVTARLAVVGAGHQSVCFRDWFDFPTLFRFTLFSNKLPKGTVSASLNMVILMVMSVSVEIGRWLWFNGGRLPFHLLAVVAGVIVVFTRRDCSIACANIRLPSWRRSGDFCAILPSGSILNVMNKLIELRRAKMLALFTAYRRCYLCRYAVLPPNFG